MTIIPDRAITHKPLKEEIFEALHREIIAGKFSPGDWLRQDVIAGQMGVSMTPVREALDLLVAAGLVERVAYRGVRVREMSEGDIAEAYGLRLLLEAEIAREAAHNITPIQLKALTEMVDQMRTLTTLEDLASVRQLSRSFHGAIAEASGNKLLIRLYAIVANAFPDWLLYEALFRKPELLVESMNANHREHEEIVESLRARDGKAAIKSSIEHVLESGKWLKEHLHIPAALLREKEEPLLVLVEKNNR
jgi:DNA-binding GntR family transcriptional regulator